MWTENKQPSGPQKAMKTAVSHNELIQALREEVLQYGELLARMDDLHEGDSSQWPAHAQALQVQQRTLEYYRRIRTEVQRSLAETLGLPEDAPDYELVLRLPGRGCQELLSALLEEQQALAHRVECGSTLDLDRLQGLSA